MKKLLPIILGLALAGTASAQTVSLNQTPAATIAVDASWGLSPTVKPFPSSASAPLAETLKLSYYDAQGQVQPWQAPVALNQETFVAAYAQRFTLPTTEGFLDSVKILIGGAAEVPEGSGGMINILIVAANLIDFPDPSPDFYLPNLSQAGLIGSAQLPAAAFAGAQNVWLTLNTQHMAVPQHFFVYVAPSFGATTNTSVVVLPSEVKFNTPSTMENSRSVIHTITGAQQSVSIMDNVFNIPTEPAAVNFYMEAFVDVETGSVARPSTSAAAMFPNPVATSSTLNIQHNEHINSVRIVNMLGSEVQSWSGKSASVKLSTSELSTGVYNVIVNTENGVTTEKLIVN